MPEVPYDLLDRISALEEQVRQLAGAAQIRPALSQILGGDVTIGQGGRLIVATPAGTSILYIGQVTPNHPDGSAQQGVIICREDGSQVMSLYRGDNNPQHWQFFDAGGAALVGDDSASGQGLARPYLATSGWFGATELPTWNTTSSTFTSVAHMPYYKQHPKVQGHFLARCSDGTTAGEMRLVDDSGIQIGSTYVLAAGAYVFDSITGSLAGSHEQLMYLHWQARVTAGSGNVAIKGLSTYGVQS